MRYTVYVDTGFWIALIDARDARHDHAKKIFVQVFNENEIVTSETIIGETVTYLNCSLKRHDLAVAFLEHLDTAPLCLLEDDLKTRIEARAILRRYADIRLSYADCVSFALMTKHGVSRFVGYDKHFSVMGFQSVH